MEIKISKVIADINIGRNTIEAFLRTKGITISPLINARIDFDTYEMLVKHFRPELAETLLSKMKRTKEYQRYAAQNKKKNIEDALVTYPLISEYVEAIKMAEDNLDQLSYLRPVLDADGRPVMSSGNFAVVFKMRDERDGTLYAIKCFTREQEGRKRAYQQISNALKGISSPYLVSIRYLANELFVNSKNNTDTEFPVVVMDWVNGKTLDNYIKSIRFNQEQMNQLSSQFFKLAEWLLKQPIAHGDLKPDNILVREDGSLVLVDYDGMFVPAMAGQQAREIGSPNFRLPNRDMNTFDRNIDDFPITTISLALRAITLRPELLDEFNASDALLFVEDDFHNIAGCKLYHKLCTMLSDNGINQLILALHLSFTGVPIGPAFFKIIGVDSSHIYDDEHVSNDQASDGINDLIQAANNGDSGSQYILGTYYEKGEIIEKDLNEAVKWYRLAAEQHNADALFRLGECYHNGNGVEQNDKEAFSWYLEAALEGQTKAQCALGRCFFYGNGVVENQKNAFIWYRKAAEKGEVKAIHRLAELYYYGWGVNEDSSKAFELYSKAAELGCAAAQYDLGEIYQYGRCDQLENITEAKKWHLLAADNGDVRAQDYLGTRYEYGWDDFPQDYLEAFKWYKKAAEQGWESAERALGFLYKSGKGVKKNLEEAEVWFKKADAHYHPLNLNYGSLEEMMAPSLDEQEYMNGLECENTGDYKGAVEYYRYAAESNNADAQNALGLCYYYGKGVEQNYDEAFEWFDKAAKQWNVDAICKLAECYFYGRGVLQDYSRSYRLVRIASEMDNIEAQSDLAVSLLLGKGVDKDPNRAIDIIMTLAERGYAPAQYNLGYIYEKGKGLQRDVTKAIRWYEKSKEQGNEDAKKALIRLNKKPDNGFSIHTADDIWEGCIILHQRFGRGKITLIDSSGKDEKIDVMFEDGQPRKLLLKFAKFQILN